MLSHFGLSLLIKFFGTLALFHKSAEPPSVGCKDLRILILVFLLVARSKKQKFILVQHDGRSFADPCEGKDSWQPGIDELWRIFGSTNTTLASKTVFFTPLRTRKTVLVPAAVENSINSLSHQEGNLWELVSTSASKSDGLAASASPKRLALHACLGWMTGVCVSKPHTLVSLAIWDSFLHGPSQVLLDFCTLLLIFFHPLPTQNRSNVQNPSFGKVSAHEAQSLPLVGAGSRRSMESKSSDSSETVRHA